LSQDFWDNLTAYLATTSNYFDFYQLNDLWKDVALQRKDSVEIVA
jgi:hypothetical protein